MSSICWSILEPKLAIPVHIHAMNLCKTSFNSLESDRHRSMLIMATFQSTYIRPMMWYYPLPLGINMMVSHVHSVANYHVPNDSRIIFTTTHHLGGSWFSSVYATASPMPPLTVVSATMVDGTDKVLAEE